MKKDIHPKYYPQATIRCACGQTFTIGATAAELRVEVCSHCHPFYTNKEKFMDTAGRIEKFKTRRVKAESAKASRKVSSRPKASSAKKETK